MFTPIWPMGAAALLLSVACWGVGSLLVVSKEPLVAMLAGWCAFLTLCGIAWVVGIPTDDLRPVFWTFFIIGILVKFRDRCWGELLAAVICSGLITAMLCAPFYEYPRLMAYGAHGTDMWGYINAAEWLMRHSIRDLPDLGNSPMRFNWIWYVLKTYDRPMNFESMACVASSCNLAPIQAYFAYPIALLASLAMALCRTRGVFRIGHWTLALLPAVALVFHTIIILPWIAGFVGGAVVALFVTLAMAGAVAAEDGPARTEALLLAGLVLVFCAPLYSIKYVYVAPAVALVPLVFSWFLTLWQKGWRGLFASRPTVLTVVAFLAAAGFAFAATRLVHDADVGGANPQPFPRALAHFLGIFGASSPYCWLGFRAYDPVDIELLANPIGCTALAGMIILFGAVSWSRWRTTRDVRVPVIVAVCLGCLWVTRIDERIMAKAMPSFGLALLVVLAVVSREFRPRTLGLMAGLICCLAAVRSGKEVSDMLRVPYMITTEDNIDGQLDGDIWPNLAYLNFREDSDGVNWKKFPQTFHGLTHFLPDDARARIAKKYDMPEPWPSPPPPPR